MNKIYKKLIEECQLEQYDIALFPDEKSSKKLDKSIKNAREEYAENVKTEDIIFFHDSTIFGNGKNGFIITQREFHTSESKNKPINLDDIAYIKNDKLYNHSGKKIITLYHVFAENDEELEFEECFNKLLKLRRLVSSVKDETIEKDFLNEKAYEYIQSAKRVNSKGFIEYLQENNINVSIDEEALERSDTLENSDITDRFSTIDKYIKYFIFMLTPLYLGMTYYKTVAGTDISGLLSIAFVTFVIYQPLQTLINRKNLDLSYFAITQDKEIMLYFRYLIIFFTLFILSTLLITLFGKSLEMVLSILSLVMLVFWWFVSRKIYTIAQSGSEFDFYKMVGLYLFMIALYLGVNFSTISSVGGMNYLFSVIGISFDTLFFGLVLMPPLGLILVNSLFGIGGKFIKSFFSVNAVQGIGSMIVPGMVITIFAVGIINSIVNSFNAYTLSFLSTVLMLAISGFGAQFQLKLFISTFIQDSALIKKYTFIAISAFYLIMMINMGLVDTVDTMSKEIHNTQKSIFNFSEKFYNHQ